LDRLKRWKCKGLQLIYFKVREKMKNVNNKTCKYKAAQFGENQAALWRILSEWIKNVYYPEQK